jgi:peptidase C39-like protein
VIETRASGRLHAVRRAPEIRWGGITVVVAIALLVGSVVGVGARHYLNRQAIAAPLPGITVVKAQPLVAFVPEDNVPSPSPAPLPDHILLQVPYTTQAPLNNWAQHQESCEEATLTMLSSYWAKDTSVVIDPNAADASIAALVRWQVQNWGSEDDLNDHRMGELAKAYYGYDYQIVPNTPDAIREQLAAGRPLIAGVRTHGLGNPNYPGYRYHYDQTGWSVPHFLLVIGYDGDGVWLNDPGISKGRGYHIPFAQLAHAIDDLDLHHPALNEGQVLLVASPHVVAPKPSHVAH